MSIDEVGNLRCTPRISIETGCTPVRYKGCVYPDVANARWSVFLDWISARGECVYSKMPAGPQSSQDQWYPLAFARGPHLIRVLTAYPSDQEIALANKFLAASYYSRITFLYGDVWNSDLRTFQCLDIQRNSFAYGYTGPDTTEKIEDFHFHWISGFHVHVLSRLFNISPWIIQGELFLYSKGERIAKVKDSPGWKKEVIEKFGITEWLQNDVWLHRLDASLNYLPDLQNKIKENAQGKSLFIKIVDQIYPVTYKFLGNRGGPQDETIRFLGDWGGPHHAISWGMPLKFVNKGYQLAQQARFEHGENGLQRRIE